MLLSDYGEIIQFSCFFQTDSNYWNRAFYVEWTLVFAETPDFTKLSIKQEPTDVCGQLNEEFQPYSINCSENTFKDRCSYLQSDSQKIEDGANFRWSR